MKQGEADTADLALMSETSREVDRAEWRQGLVSESCDRVVEEFPVALVYNGISHAVMMATPADLEDFALGFSLTEGILDAAEELLDIEVSRESDGISLNITILGSRFDRLKKSRRTLTGRSGCGLCGVESLEMAIRQARKVRQDYPISHISVDRAIKGLPGLQLLQQATGGVHAAAWCSSDGDILFVREDVGRHNALDKLIGAIKTDPTTPGFILMTSRASYEIVGKTAMAGIPVIAAVSAPTGLAIDLAAKCGITLMGFSAPGRHVVYTGSLIGSDS